MRSTEKQLFKVYQERVKHSQVVGVELEDPETDLSDFSVELSFNDGVRSKTVELPTWMIDETDMNDVSNKVMEDIFSTKCTYPESISIWQQLDIETGTWGIDTTKTFKSENTWCGQNHYEIESAGSMKWLWHSNADYILKDGSWGKPGPIDLFQDSNIVNSFCLAYFERLDEIQVKLSISHADGVSESNRVYGVNLDAGSKTWKFECINFNDLFAEDEWVTGKTGVYSMEFKEMLVKNNDNGNNGLILIDDFIIGYTDAAVSYNGDGGDMTRNQGLRASDGRSVSGVNVQKHGNSLIIEAFRDYNVDMDKSKNAVCGWNLPSGEVTKINGVSVGAGVESTVMLDANGLELASWAFGKHFSYSDGLGLTVFSHHQYQPGQGYSGGFTIEGEAFDSETVQESDIVEFYSVVLKHGKLEFSSNAH